MTKTKKITHRLQEGEAMVIGPTTAFHTLIAVAEAFSTMDEYSYEEQLDWKATAEWMQEWIDETAFWDEDEV